MVAVGIARIIMNPCLSFYYHTSNIPNTVSKYSGGEILNNKMESVITPHHTIIAIIIAV